MTSDWELYLKPNTKILNHKRNIGKTDIKIHVVDTTPKSWCIKEENNKLDFVKVKNFFMKQNKDKS